MKTKLIAAALLAQIATLAAATSPADAHERWRYESGKRQTRQMELIYEGRRHGNLTWREFRILRGEQFRIARMKRSFLTDGRLDWTERQSLRFAQDAANHHIFHERNDAEQRHWW